MKPERPEQFRKRRDPQPRQGPIQDPTRPGQPFPHPRRAFDLKPPHVAAVPHTDDRPRLGRVGQEAIGPGPGVPAGDGEEGGDGEAVAEYGVDVSGEELGGGEFPAVENLSVGGRELQDGELGADPDPVREYGLDQDRRGPELGVGEFLSEEIFFFFFFIRS